MLWWFDHNLWRLAGHHSRREPARQAQSDDAVSCASNRGRASLRRVTAVWLPNNCPIPMPGYVCCAIEDPKLARPFQS
jgi:hypothetical protein